MLYLSAYLKAHQQEYYDRLQQVRKNGNYEAWLRFFLEGDRFIAANVGAYAIFKKCEDMGLIRQVNQGRRNRGLVSSDVDS